MLSVVSEKDGDTVYIHADLEGIQKLESCIANLKRELENNECPHDHLMSKSWGSDELTETMLDSERSDGCVQVHHVKLYGWNQEWALKHGLQEDA